MSHALKRCKETHPAILRCAQRAFLLSLGVLIGLGSAGAQAAAEYAGVTAKMGAAATAVNAAKKVVLPSSPQKDPQFQHLVARTGEPIDVINRRALEERAGKDAAKLLLRSVPNGAQVWIHGELVGSTPLLLILAPGNYQVEMRGPQMEFGQAKVDLLPQEKRELVMILEQRYPAHVRLRLGRMPSTRF